MAGQRLGFLLRVGTAADLSSVRHTFARIASKAGLPEVKFVYLLRHTAVSLLLDDGASIEEVADVTGDDPKTLYRHYRHRVHAVADASLRLGKLFDNR